MDVGLQDDRSASERFLSPLPYSFALCLILSLSYPSLSSLSPDFRRLSLLSTLKRVGLDLTHISQYQVNMSASPFLSLHTRCSTQRPRTGLTSLKWHLTMSSNRTLSSPISRETLLMYAHVLCLFPPFRLFLTFSSHLDLTSSPFPFSILPLIAQPHLWAAPVKSQCPFILMMSLSPNWNLIIVPY